MNIPRIVMVAALGLVVVAGPALAQRGGRGGGGQRGGGGMQRGGGGGGGMQRGGGGFGGGLSGGGGGGGASRGSSAMGSFGGTGSRQTSSRSYSGAQGGQMQSRSGSGTYDTSRGGTINYGAAGAGGTTAGGTTAGRGAYGVQGTTAGGKSYSDYGRVGGVSGAGGNTVAGRSNVGSVSGANGTAYGGSRSMAGTGPQGAFGGTQYGRAAVGEDGAVATGGRAGAAYGPAGGVAGASSGAVAATPRGTYYASSSDLAARGEGARGAYWGSAASSPNWYANNPTAWVAPRTNVAVVGAPTGWGAVAGYCGYPQQPPYYDYGGNVVAQPDAMYVNGDPAGTPQQYADQAAQIAATGAGAPADPNGEWQPIGVFGIAGPDEAPPNEFFQLAINPQGVIRGNYHNAQTNATVPVAGAVDSKTLRAAWTIGDQKDPVFEAGIANLTKDQTTMLVHDGADQPQQVVLVRMPPPPDDPGQPQSAPPQ